MTMTLKEQLLHIFNGDYPGTERFIAEVLRPIFGEEIATVGNDLLEDHPEYRAKAEKAGIERLEYVADITEQNYNADNIAFFDVTLSDHVNIERSRVNIQQLIRSIVQSYQHILVVFHYASGAGLPWRFSYAYKADTLANTTNAKRYTYVFGRDFRARTAAERFVELAHSECCNDDFTAAFSVEALSDEFFDKYREQYDDLIQYITGKRFVKVGSKWQEKILGEPNAVLMQAFGHNEKKIRDYVKKMMGRITFLHFMQRKGWMCGDLNYMQNVFERSLYKDNYLDYVLEPLFYGILNTKPAEREEVFAKEKWDKSLLDEWKDIPYLNGGLFERDDEDKLECKFPADNFHRLFQFFSEYNFTIDENDPNDAEIGVDPEMLGKIFENLLEDNKDKGAFYTPKEIVHYMCQESLIAYLETNTSVAKDKIRQFVLSPEESVADIPENKKPKLLAALEEVKICDPAIGSGAFPMGMLNALLHCREALIGEHYDRAEIKKSIIQNNIYGVDIEKGAVDIARLRFWLSIVVDEETPSPLPNLDYKIMQGNSLVESFMGVDLSRLTYEKEYKTDNAQISLFDDEKNRLQKTVSRLLLTYYFCSDHDRKEELRREISDTINKQLEAQSYDSAILRELKNINLAENNKFFLWHTWFVDVFEKGGFDIVIGNPPYIKELGNEHIFAPVISTAWGKKYHAGKMDYWFYFLHKAIELTNGNGVITFITSRYWINSSGARRLIKHICAETDIINIVDIGKLKVFDNVVGYHMISILSKPKAGYTCNYYAISDDVKNIETKQFSTQRMISQETLISNGEIVIENRIGNNVGLTLEDICNVSQGVVEASDKISTKMYKKNPNPNHHVGEGIFVLSLDELRNVELTESENSIMMLFEDDGCISRYIPDYCKTRRLIYADTANRRKIATDEQFSNLKAHLDRMSEYITSTYKPYGLHRARKFEDFTQPKLIGPSMFVKPCYCYDTRDLFVGMSYNIITPKDGCNLLFLLGVINSSYAQYWFFSNAKHRGAGVDVGVDKLRQFPVPRSEQAQEQPIIDLVQDIFVAKANDANADISYYETQIDTLVYQLYGLDADEIKLIEDSLK